MTDKEREIITAVIAAFDEATNTPEDQVAWGDFVNSGGVEPLRQLLSNDGTEKAVVCYLCKGAWDGVYSCAGVHEHHFCKECTGRINETRGMNCPCDNTVLVS